MTNDGGLAFPGEHYEIDERSGTRVCVNHPGMSLRDYFAAKAMQGIITNGLNATYEAIAKRSYVVADAMIKARNK
jgi:hypothetical protein